MTRKEMVFTQLCFILWFVDFNVQGIDVLPDFLGIIFLACALYSMAKSGEIKTLLIPLLGILCVDFGAHWFLDFELPYEILAVRIVAGIMIFLYFGLIMMRLREQDPGIATGVEVCRMAYLALLILDYVSLELVIFPLMLAEVAGGWIITLALVILLCRAKPVEAKKLAA